LKKEKLRVEKWSDKTLTSAAVYNTVSNTLFDSLPHPTYQQYEIELKTNMVYEHLRQQYYGGGLSVYGEY
jgi:type I restriction enzyme R subunit